MYRLPLLANIKPRPKQKQKQIWVTGRPNMKSPASVSAITAIVTFQAANTNTQSSRWLPRPRAEATRAAAGRNQSRGRRLRKVLRSLASFMPEGPARTVATASSNIESRRALLAQRVRRRNRDPSPLPARKREGARAAGDRNRGTRKSGGPPLAFLPLACLRLCGAPAPAYLRMHPVSARRINRRTFA